jgi:predicted solute-binding protein
VNDYSLDIGKEGLSAVQEFLRRAESIGIKKRRDDLLCVM